jgi:predicted lipid carrier protein YhbT
VTTMPVHTICPAILETASSIQTMTDSPDKAPLFPRLLSLPLAIIPNRVHSTTVVTVLNRVLADALRDGELDYLQGRTVRICVRDMQLTFCITLQQGRLAASREKLMPDLSITGTLHAFLLLAARYEDTDTLFFQRRLRMEGDTELGLEVKNFLDGLDVDALWLPRQVSSMAQKALPLYERTCS